MRIVFDELGQIENAISFQMIAYKHEIISLQIRLWNNDMERN